MTTRNRRVKVEPAAKGGRSLAGGLIGATAGAALMYLLDPRSGRRRRAMAKDKVRHSLHEAEVLAGKARRDASHRAKGVLAEGRARLRHEEVSDEVLHERVRAQLGRYCSHPRAIEVCCRDGEVELRGACLAAEHEKVLAGIGRVRGAKRVVDLLEIHAEADVSSLQGGASRSGPRSEPRQRSWTPAMRLAGLLAGATLFAAGVFRRRKGGNVLGLIGASLAARAVANRPAKELLKGGPVEIHKSVLIHAPVSEIFGFFAQPENLPRFMTHVKDVHHVGDGGYHWVVEGPAGQPFSWDATFDAIENEHVTWRSVPGSTVDNRGSVHFDEQGDGTRLTVHLIYHPPGGALGHAFARALGADPKGRMDDDLVRLKSLLEDGSVTGRFGKVTREEVELASATKLFGPASARAPEERQ